MEAVGFSRHLPVAASAGMDGKLIVWDANGWSQRGVCEHPTVGGPKRRRRALRRWRRAGRGGVEP